MLIFFIPDAGCKSTLGPTGLDYGITGLIIEQLSGKSRRRSPDALE